MLALMMIFEVISSMGQNHQYCNPLARLNSCGSDRAACLIYFQRYLNIAWRLDVRNVLSCSIVYASDC